MTAHDLGSGLAARPRDAETWIRTPDPSSSANLVADPHTARLGVDITRVLRGRIRIAAFRGSVGVAEMLRDLLAREFPDTDGGCS
jgi:hypothetical protein